MPMAPTEFAGARPIDGNGPGFFRIAGQVHRGPVLVHEKGVSPWGGLDDTGALAALGGAELLLIGTGAATAQPPAALTEAARAAGLRPEAMSSPAAARSYNVLLSEGRAVAAALIPI